jgi:phage-related minor tail protein
MSVEIASAYIAILPSFAGLQQNLSRGFAGAGKRIGNEIADDMKKADFEGAGKRAGQQFSDGADSEMDSGGERSGGSFLDGLGGKGMAGLAGIAAAAGAAFVGAFTEAMDVTKARALTQAQLGVDPKTAELLGQQAGDLYSRGYGESLSAANAAITTVASSLPDLFGDDLTAITGQVLSFSQAFGVDTADAVQSVNTLLYSGLAKDAPAALDLLTASAQQVPEALRGNVLDAADEYGQFFNTLGFSGEEAFGALVKGAEKGEFGIDKTGDAIKEFTILATSGDKAVTDAFGSIGLDATAMSDSILAGGDTAKVAFGQIIDGILGIEDPTAQAQAALALFGTPLEDMNVAEIPQFLEGLDQMDGGLQGVEGAAAAMDTALGSTTSSVELMWRGVKTKVVDFFVDEVLPAIADVTAWLGEHLAPVVEKVGIWFKEKLVPFLQLAWEWFEVNLLPALVRFGEFVGTTFGNIMTVVDGIIDFLTGVFSGDWEAAWEGIKQIFSGFWDQIKNLAGLAWDQIVALVQGIGPTIGEILLSFGDQIIQWGGDLLTWLWDGMQAVWANVVDWFASLPGWAWEQISAFTGWLVDRGAEFLGWIWDGIKAKGIEVFAWFAALPAAAWAGVVALAGTVTQYGVDFITWIKDGIVSGAQGIWDFITSIPGRIAELVKGIGSFLSAIGGKIVDWIVEGVKGAANAVVDAIAGLFGGITFTDNGELSAANGYIAAVGLGAGGGVIPGYAPGVDNVPAVLSPGEGVMVPEFVRAVGPGWVYAMNRAARAGRSVDAARILGTEMFADGGIAGRMRDIGAGFGSWMGKGIKNGDQDTWLDQLSKRTFGTLAGKGGPAFSPISAGNYDLGGGVEQWRGLALQALAATGENAGNINALLYQMQTESGGNPNAINLWDINAQRGYPSMGLLQVIRPTFVSALSGTPFANLIPRGQTDPWANIIASILYARGRYGSLQNAYRGVAYKNGGIVPGNVAWGIDSVPAMLTPGEGVFTPPQTQAILAHAEALEAGYSGQQQINIYLDNSDPLQVAVAGMIQDGLDREGSNMRVMAAQRP